MPETVLITGASSGIGKALAKLFAAEGSQLVLTARREQALEELADELRQRHKVQVHVFPADLAEADAPEDLFQAILQAGLTIDVLVNNAGLGQLDWFWKIPIDRHLDMIQVNVTALTELTRLFIAPMRERERGSILNVSSTAAFQPGPHMAVYYATKAFVLSLSEALNEEHRRSGINVTCLCPGPTDTGFAGEANMAGTWLFKFAMPVERVAWAGYCGFRRGKAVVVPGLINKLMVQLPRFTPRWITRWAVGLLQPIPHGPRKS